MSTVPTDLDPTKFDRATYEKAQQFDPSDYEEPPLKIAMTMPTHDMVPAGFMYDMANLCAFSSAKLIMDGVADIALNMLQATVVHAAREELAQRAVAGEFTHVLWLDTDHRFPKNALLRLLNHNKPIVGINYSTRAFPPQFTAYKTVDPERPQDKQRLQTLESSTGLEEVDALGFGLLLVQTRVFVDTPKPWFDFTWRGGSGFDGEDVHFCRRARKAGYPSYVDHDLSKVCRHIGQFEYSTQHVEALIEEEGQGGDN